MSCGFSVVMVEVIMVVMAAFKSNMAFSYCMVVMVMETEEGLLHLMGLFCVWVLSGLFVSVISSHL